MATLRPKYLNPKPYTLLYGYMEPLGHLESIGSWDDPLVFALVL